MQSMFGRAIGIEAAILQLKWLAAVAHDNVGSRGQSHAASVYRMQHHQDKLCLVQMPLPVP